MEQRLARSTLASHPRRASNRSSIRCRRSAKRVRPSSRANGTRGGCVCRTGMTMAGSPAPHWDGPLYRSCSQRSRRGEWISSSSTRSTRCPPPPPALARWPSASGRLWGGKPFARGALYRRLQNRIYRGEIVHKERSYPGEHTPIIDRELWDAVQARLAGNAAQRKAGGRVAQPSLLAGLLFDGEGNRMTPSHAVTKGTRYRYYVSRPLITKDRPHRFAGRRIPAAEIEHLVASRVRQWLLDPGGIYKAISAWLPQPSAPP